LILPLVCIIVIAYLANIGLIYSTMITYFDMENIASKD